MEEERLEIVNVEELKKKMKKNNRLATLDGIVWGVETVFIIQRIIQLVKTGNMTNIFLILIYGFWGYKAIKDMANEQLIANECEEIIRHYNQRDSKNIDENIIKDDIKAENRKAGLLFILTNVLLAVGSVLSDQAIKINNILLELGAATLGGISGYCFKKVNESYLREISLQNDIKLIKG